MTTQAPIEVVLLTPPRMHPLASALRTTIERVASRPGVRLVERAEAPRERVAFDEVRQRFVVGLEVGACDGIAIGLSTNDREGPVWIVPEAVFDTTLDGLERIQRLGSALAAGIDLVSSDAGREWLRGDALSQGVTQVLAGTAQLSADALHEALARRRAARAAALMVAALDEGRDWEIDDWALPAELDVAAVTAAARTESPEVLRQRALAAAEGLAREVAASVDQALATHGLAALVPLQGALDRLMARVTPREIVAVQIKSEALPSTSAVDDARRRLDALPRPLPGSMWLALGWAAPSGALVGLAAPASGGVAIAAGSGVFVALATLARGWQGLRTTWSRRTLEAAQADYDAAQSALADARREAQGPELVRGALTWFREQVQRERQRLAAVETHVRLVARRDDGVGVRMAVGAGDQAVDLSAAKALLDPAPEPLVQRARAELADEWRTSLPTLMDLTAAARGLGSIRAPWADRSDVAKALVQPLRDALALVDGHLARRVPRGMPARRLALVPTPFHASELDLKVDAHAACRGDAHLLLAWRTT